MPEFSKVIEGRFPCPYKIAPLKLLPEEISCHSKLTLRLFGKLVDQATGDELPGHSVWFAVFVICGIGLTDMEKVVACPEQLPAIGVTVNVEVKILLLVLVVENSGIFPVPLAAIGPTACGVRDH